VDTDECELCAEYDKAIKETEYKPLACPHCNEPLEGALDLSLSFRDVVGETNVVGAGPFEYTDLFQCYSCKKFFMLKPVPIIWNANHDIYYRRAPT
jgi:hypothetical protein